MAEQPAGLHEHVAAGAVPRARRWRARALVPSWPRLLLSDRRAAVGAGIVLFFVFIAICGPVIWQGDPGRPNYSIPPQTPPSSQYWLGSDQQSHNIFLQLVDGTRPSLVLGVSVGLLSTTIAILVGMSAGYFGGWIDDLLSLLTNIVLIIPGLPLVIVLAAWIQAKSDIPIILILGCTGWAGGARVLRSQTLSMRGKDFVQAATVRGESGLRVVLRDILPNMFSLVVSNFLGATIGAIGATAGLQFLGLGNLSEVSWFSTLYWAQNNTALLTGAWWTFVPAGVAIALLVTGLALVNFGIDAISNPRLRRERVRRPRPAAHPARQSSAKMRDQLPAPAPPYGTEATNGAPGLGSDDPLVDVRKLCIEYITARGSVGAVDNVSFLLRRGEVLGLAGESGCGKSTTANAIMRLLKPPAYVTGGTIKVNGQDVSALDPEELRRFRWSQVSMVSQSAMNALNPIRTVGAHFLDTLQAHRGIGRRAALERGAQLLQIVGIERARLQSYPHELSGGMRQRVSIALALALDPDVVILDEPTTALDVVVQREILQQIEDLKQRFGFSLLFITHDLSLLVEFSDRIAIMYAGKLVEVAPAGALFQAPLHPYTVGLMHSFPAVDAPDDEVLTGIPGAPPDLSAPPSGCRFHPRCLHAMDVCRQAEPVLTRMGAERAVACHLYTHEAAADVQPLVATARVAGWDS